MDGGAPAQRREEGGGRREKSRRRWLGQGRLRCANACCVDHGEGGTDGGGSASHVDPRPKLPTPELWDGHGPVMASSNLHLRPLHLKIYI